MSDWWMAVAVLPLAVTFAYRQWSQTSTSPGASAGRGYDLMGEHLRTGDRQTLEAAISELRRGVRATRGSRRQRAACLSNLSIALLLRARLDGLADDAAESVSLARDVLLTIDEGHADWTKHVNNLAEAVRTQAHVTRRSELADEAVALARTAVQGTSQDHPRRSARVGNLQLALRLQEQLRKSDDGPTTTVG